MQKTDQICGIQHLRVDIDHGAELVGAHPVIREEVRLHSHSVVSSFV
jgi:hypothetical protein